MAWPNDGVPVPPPVTSYYVWPDGTRSEHPPPMPPPETIVGGSNEWEPRPSYDNGSVSYTRYEGPPPDRAYDPSYERYEPPPPSYERSADYRLPPPEASGGPRGYYPPYQEGGSYTRHDELIPPPPPPVEYRQGYQSDLRPPRQASPPRTRSPSPSRSNPAVSPPQNRAGSASRGLRQQSPQRSPVRPRDFDDTKSERSEAFSLALTDATTIRPGADGTISLSLMEELILIKAGDSCKFTKKSRKLDTIVASALLLELIVQGRIGINEEVAPDPRKLVLQLLDETPTGSKLIDSALGQFTKSTNKHMTVQRFLKKASPDLTQGILWRLVKKGQLGYDPRFFGNDKYPVKEVKALNQARERVMAVMNGSEQQLDGPPMRDILLSFLYYLPKNAVDKILGDSSDRKSEELRSIGCAIVYSLDVQQTQQSWI